MIRSFVAPAVVSFALSWASVASAANQVWVVAPSAGVGIDFTNVQTAINAASDGDTLLIRSGTYNLGQGPVYSIQGKGLTLVEDAGATVVFANPLNVGNLTASQQLCLRGIDVLPNLSTSIGVGAAFSNCAGRVWIEDCQLTGQLGSAFVPVGPGLDLSACASVTVARSTLTGTTTSIGFGGGLPGLDATNSSVALYDCMCVGGNGGSGASILSGGDGALLNGGFLFASGTTFKGGKGGSGANNSGPFNPCTNGASGGNGVHLAANSAAFSSLACVFTAGAGGAGGSGAPGCGTGPSGLTVKITSGAHTLLAGTAHSLTCSATCREAQTFTLTYKGVPGELVFIDFSALQGFQCFPDFRGVLVLGFPLTTIFQGTIPASGTLVKTSGTINDLGAGVEGATLYLQSAFASAANGLFQAGPSATVLLDASL